MSMRTILIIIKSILKRIAFTEFGALLFVLCLDSLVSPSSPSSNTVFRRTFHSTGRPNSERESQELAI